MLLDLRYLTITREQATRSVWPSDLSAFEAAVMFSHWVPTNESGGAAASG